MSSINLPVPGLNVPELDEGLVLDILNSREWVDITNKEKEDIARCFIAYDPSDGYDLAKKLDQYFYWNCDSHTVEFLDEILDEIDGGYMRHLKDWAVVNRITPKYSVGDKLPSGNYIICVDSEPMHYDVAPSMDSAIYRRVRFDAAEGWGVYSGNSIKEAL